MQQHTVYTNEVDASLFTMDTTIPCDYNVSVDTSNQTVLMKITQHHTIKRNSFQK